MNCKAKCLWKVPLTPLSINSVFLYQQTYQPFLYLCSPAALGSSQLGIICPEMGGNRHFAYLSKGIPLLMFFPFCNENYFLSWLLSLGPCQFSPRQRGLSICRSFQGRLNRPKGGVPKLLPTSEWELFCQPRQRSVTVLRASPPSLWLSLTLPSSVQHSEQVLEAHSFKFIFLLCQIKSISDL